MVRTLPLFEPLSHSQSSNNYKRKNNLKYVPKEGKTTTNRLVLLVVFEILELKERRFITRCAQFVYNIRIKMNCY